MGKYLASDDWNQNQKPEPLALSTPFQRNKANQLTAWKPKNGTSHKSANPSQPQWIDQVWLLNWDQFRMMYLRIKASVKQVTNQVTHFLYRFQNNLRLENLFFIDKSAFIEILVGYDLPDSG